MKKRFFIIGAVLFVAVSFRLSPLKGKIWRQIGEIIRVSRVQKITQQIEMQKKELIRETSENTAKNLVVVNIRDRYGKTAKLLAIKYIKNEPGFSPEEHETVNQGMRHDKERWKALRAVREFYERHYKHSSGITVESIKNAIDNLGKKIERILK